MNKFKALLVVGLLSLSSVSFATSVSYTQAYIDSGIATAVADTAQAGTINLDADGTTAYFKGTLAGTQGGTGTTSTWYELILGSNSGSNLLTFGWAANTLQPTDLVVSLLDASGGAIAGLSDIGDALGNFSVSLASGTTYRLLLSGTEGLDYNGNVSAVPVPAAGILFASALFGAGVLGRRKKKAKASVVGAFARAS